MPQIEDCWIIDIFTNDFVKNTISWKLYEMLLKIRFDSLVDHTDELYKLKPLIEILMANFKSLNEYILPYRDLEEN